MKKIVVIAHDAGGAEIVAAYASMYRGRTQFEAYVSGPAIKPFRRAHLPFKLLRRKKISAIISAHKDARLILLGTGTPWGVELAALKEAKKQGCKTAVYLDSWTRYRERFGYGREKKWRLNLPDEIWVGDKPAHRLAEKFFPPGKLRLVPNQYFKDISARHRSLSKKIHKDSILFFSASDVATGRKSVVLLSDFLAQITLQHNLPNVRVRLHPNDVPDRYRDVIHRYRGRLRIAISKESDLVRDISRARIAVGGETTALVISALLGVPTITIAKKNTSLLLPHYTHVSSIKGAMRALVTLLRN